MGTLVKFVTNPAAIAELLESPTGEVGNHVVNLATIVQLKAQAIAPVKTGRLKAGIVKRFVAPEPASVGVQVGVWTVPYALWVHEGTEPHNIPNAWGWGPNVGTHGRFNGKWHPGTKAQPFLTESLEAIASEL